MSERSPHRRPQTFKLDDPGVVVIDPDDQGRPARGAIRITPEPDPALLPVPLEPVPMLPARTGLRWGRFMRLRDLAGLTEIRETHGSRTATQLPRPSP